MISSKAICTGKKKIKLFIALLFVFIGTAFAESYNIGLVIESDASIAYVDRFSAMLSFASGEVVNEEFLKAARSKDIRGEVIEYEKAFSSAVKNEEDASLIRRNVRDKSAYASNVITLDLDENDLYYVSLSDEAAIRYIKHINDLDELYYIRVETDRGLSDVEIFLDGTPLFHFIYSEFVETSAEEEILKYLTLRYKGSDYTLLRFDGMMDVSIYADSALASRYRSYVLLPFGLHRIRLQSPGFEPYETDYVAASSFDTLNYEMTELSSGALFISTIPYSNEIYYQGQIVDSGYVMDATYPFSLIVNKDGYETRSLQSDSAESSLVTVLLPSELYLSERTEEKKNEFYTHLLITLLSFGSSVATDVVADVYSLDYLRPLTVAFQGFSVIELVRTVTALFEYRDSLSYGI